MCEECVERAQDLIGTVESEMGSEWREDMMLVYAVCAHLSGVDANSFSLGLELGLRAALAGGEDYTRRLVNGLGYTRQLLGNAQSNEALEQVVALLTSGNSNRQFGQLPQRHEDSD